MEEDYVRLSNVHRHTVGSAGRDIDIIRMELGHAREHGNIGMDVELTAGELDRPHLVLQALSGGLVDEPSVAVAIGEHILQCLTAEVMKACREM